MTKEEKATLSPFDPFVLVYEITKTEVRFIDFDHHDKVYKKKYDEIR